MKKMSFTNFSYLVAILLTIVSCNGIEDSTSQLTINEQEYFEMPGLNVMVYHDYYSIGRQGGISIVQNGERIASNGDIRLTNVRRPFPTYGERIIDRDKNEINIEVGFPDSLRKQHKDPRYPFPDIQLQSTVRLVAEGSSIRIFVDLKDPLPEKWENKVEFRLELFPGHFFDKTYYMDGNPGTFPRQANGPFVKASDGSLSIKPLAAGNKLVALPETKHDMLTIESLSGDLELVDSRGRNKAGWFAVRSSLKAGKTNNALEWVITPAIKPNYEYTPVIQVSQVGYRTNQEKVAVLELDKRVERAGEMKLLRINESGELKEVMKGIPDIWGQFLRYNYARLDFSNVQDPGMYKLQYGDILSHPFMIHEDIYKRHVWQPTLEYYLPVQMCHMRINHLVKVWHGLCHEDDALMAPVDHVHFDGYKQGSSTLCKYNPFQAVPDLNVGGWHDAGDYDLRVESQANTVRMLAYSWELFETDYDLTTIDQENKRVEIHVPDGKDDILQQIEHGALTIIAGYKALGRLYRGIICPTGRQYSLLGDGSVMTDNLIYNANMDSTQRSANRSGIRDDRWVFTEENPRRELFVAACLATAYRSLKGYNDDLADDCLETAKTLWDQHSQSGNLGLIDPAAELYLSTNDIKYINFIYENETLVFDNLRRTGAAMGRIASKLDNSAFMEGLQAALKSYADELEEQINETPYGVQYTPNVWGAGWTIQSFGVNHYFLHTGFPDIFSANPVFNSMNFVLGVHPGTNNASFVSGVGAKSLLVAYGVNRDDWSFIPGGSASGTALIRPDLPELKEWPYLWQQTEYVMGGGAMNYMFLVLATDALLAK
jgi:endoglucanase